VRAEPTSTQGPAGDQPFSTRRTPAREVYAGRAEDQASCPRDAARAVSLVSARRPRAEVHLKLECAQVTGSFKATRCLNKLLALGDADRRRVRRHRFDGNHGLAMAHALAQLGCETARSSCQQRSPAKRERSSRARRAFACRGGPRTGRVDCAARRPKPVGESTCRPYNDPQIIGDRGPLRSSCCASFPGSRSCWCRSAAAV
jgi:hypothetical protein